MAGPHYISKCKNRCLSAPSEARELQKERNFLSPRRSWQLESVLRPHIDWTANLNSMIRRNGDGQGATSCQPLRHSAAGGGESPLAWHLRRSSSPTLVNENKNDMSESNTDSEWLFLVLCVCVLCICFFVCCSCLGPRALLPGSITRTQQRALCD